MRQESQPTNEHTEPVPAEQSDSTALDLRSDKTPRRNESLLWRILLRKDSEAWAYLTQEAQQATKDSFEAQASDTIRWNITKVDRDNNNAYVYINVSDLNDSGDVTSGADLRAQRSEQMGSRRV